MNRSYPWKGGEERLRTQGETKPIQLLILPALFDEANRMRRMTLQLMRRLDEHDIGTMLPDLPGTGESVIELADVSWADWADAVRVVAERLPVGERLSVAIRGGALLDRHVGSGGAHRAWQFSPETGQRVLGDMTRTMRVAGRDMPGYAMAESLERHIGDAKPGAADRVVRLSSDRAAADRHVEGPPLWRRSEPGEDITLVETLVADIVAWVRR